VPCPRGRRASLLVDLHLHTTASDGRFTPGELVDAAVAGALRVMAVTDHDTTAAVAEVQTLAGARGIEAIAGIEITAVDAGRDVHVLGYFIDMAHAGFAEFLSKGRAQRSARVKAMGERLASLGVPIDVAPLLADAQKGRSLGRPLIARAMVAAGHVADVQEAFDKYLAQGLPGFVAREGASSEHVVAMIKQAGGIASLAHPGTAISDARITALRDAGLDALEVFHPDHDAALTQHHAQLAARLGLLATGGSDFHGDPSHGHAPGAVTLPEAEWERLRAAARDGGR
jgi:3',5'-nucleoside bisphosphate phosphatase